jgi:hypothetical protein
MAVRLMHTMGIKERRSGMRKMHRWSILVAALVLALAILACNSPTRETPTAAPPTATEEGASPATVEPTPSEQAQADADTPAPTDTSEPDVSGPGGCTYNSRYVADVTIPDDTEIDPGASFVKTWRVKNTGTCTWEEGTTLTFISGEPFGAPVSVPIEQTVSAGDNVDVSVDMVAPMEPGTYRARWQLESPDGKRFGNRIYVQIVVPDEAAPTSETVTETPTEETPEVVCTPPACATEEVLVCPEDDADDCSGGCGVVCATVTPSCVEFDPIFDPVLDWSESAGIDLGCATAPPQNVYGAWQVFWANVDDVNPHTHYRSLMIWRSDTGKILVVDGENTDASQGSVLNYVDTWNEGDPPVHPDCEAMDVPDGYEMPVRGFGKVWCTEELWDAIGWPDQSEVGGDIMIQPTQDGVLMKISGYLVATDYSRAVTVMVP